jgi:hypothetical protein
MKRMWMAAAVAAVVLAGAARADFGGPPPATAPVSYPGAEYGNPDPGCQDRYGVHPLFRKLLWWKKDGDCGPGSCGAGGHAGGHFAGKGGCGPGGCGLGGRCGPGGCGAGGGVGTGMDGMGAPMGGTLVFPNHWYARGPRDYFMYDAPRR